MSIPNVEYFSNIATPSANHIALRRTDEGNKVAWVVINHHPYLVTLFVEFRDTETPQVIRDTLYQRARTRYASEWDWTHISNYNHYPIYLMPGSRPT